MGMSPPQFARTLWSSYSIAKDQIDVPRVGATLGGELPICQACFDLYTEHMSLMARYTVFTPKHHLAFHLLANTRLQGNPSFYATWFDEALNQKLKAACRQTSQMNFECPILLRMVDLMREVAR